MEYSTPIPLGVWQIAAHAETHPLSRHLVEDYQIAFFCDNLFLPGLAGAAGAAGAAMTWCRAGTCFFLVLF
jgi:hypothetical protein